ncbi:MAG: hypothetical protein ACK528_02580 [Alphaproteobacteria bacterium]
MTSSVKARPSRTKRPSAPRGTLNVAEINPISVHADALIALDARLILAEEQAG